MSSMHGISSNSKICLGWFLLNCYLASDRSSPIILQESGLLFPISLFLTCFYSISIFLTSPPCYYFSGILCFLRTLKSCTRRSFSLSFSQFMTFSIFFILILFCKFYFGGFPFPMMECAGRFTFLVLKWNVFRMLGCRSWALIDLFFFPSFVWIHSLMKAIACSFSSSFS